MEKIVQNAKRKIVTKRVFFSDLKFTMNGSAAVKVIIVFVIVLLIGMVCYVFITGSSGSTNVMTNQTNAVSPTIPVKDFAPEMPANQKTTILIQTSDSSDIKYIVPTDQVGTYIKSLPEGYRVVSKTP
jgi:flagellar basal body-associated protein FliL